MKTKMMAACSLVAMVAVLSGCSIGTQKTVDDVNANSTLEIDLLTSVDEVDFSDFGVVPGFGITGYYDKKYGDWDADIGAVSACYVQYDVTSYPDYMSKKKYVTGIRVTDPEVSVYGYCVGDNANEYKAFLIDKGFKLDEEWDRIKRFENGKLLLRFSLEPETQQITSISVEVDVTNCCGVIF